jgi:hypothetical protein
MADKDQSFRRKIIPYLLLAFALISTILIVLDVISNLGQL